METSARLQEAIRAAGDPSLVMERIAEQSLALIGGAEGAAVELLVDGALTFVCAGGTLARFVGSTLPGERSLSALALRSGRTLRSDDGLRDPRVDAALCQRLGTASLVCVPLHSGDASVGVLIVVSAQMAAFTDEDVATLTGLACFITTAITTTFALQAAAEALLASAGSAGSPEADDERLSLFVANVAHPALAAESARRSAVSTALAQRLVAVELQPIVDVQAPEPTLVGAEALARVRLAPERPPDAWFADARRAGLAAELHLAALEAALAAAGALPPGAFLAVNVDPGALANAELVARLAAVRRPLVVELTEHVAIDNYPLLRERIAGLRAGGVRIALDDTGAGHSSLTHLVQLAPDLIKLDLQLVVGADADPVRRALLAAVVAFAREIGAKVIAEGIETPGELAALRALGVDYGQGYLLGRPAAPSELAAHWLPTRPSVPVR